MDHARGRTTAFALLFALVPLASCSVENGTNGITAQDFTGNYNLVSFAQGTAAGVIPVQGATGTMTLTATGYQAALTVPPAPAFNDEGTYSAVGSETSGTWEQQSTLDANLQYAGTYAWDPAARRLTLDTTAQGIRYVLVVQKN